MGRQERKQKKDEGDKPIRAVVGEGPQLVRAGLKSLLSEGGVLVIGEAGSWEEMLRLVGALSPDVLVCDFDLCPGGGWSISRLEQCVEDLKTVKFIVLGGFAYKAKVEGRLPIKGEGPAHKVGFSGPEPRSDSCRPYSPRFGDEVWRRRAR